MVNTIAVNASFHRFGVSFYCKACGSELSDHGKTLEHPTVTKRILRSPLPSACPSAGKKFIHPFRPMVLKEVQ